MKLTMWRVVVVLNVYGGFGKNSLIHPSFIEFKRGMQRCCLMWSVIVF